MGVLSVGRESIGVRPVLIANLKASQAKLKATGRDLTLEDVYALEMGDG